MLKFSGIYILLALQFILVNMNNFIADPQLYADLTYFTLFIISFIACYEWFKNTPNTRTRIKCLILFEMLYLITNILAFPVYYLNIAFVMKWIRAIALSFWIGYIIFRNGQATPSRLNDKDIFAVRSKASGIQDYILALLNKYELGSYGLYYNGNYYHYRHGILVKDSKKLLQAKKEKFVIIKSKSYDKETISKIEQLVGTRWNIINNCFTRIRPLLKEKNKNGKN